MKHKPYRWNEWKDIEVPKTYAAYSDDRLLEAFCKQKLTMWRNPANKAAMERHYRLRRELHRRLTGE